MPFLTTQEHALAGYPNITCNLFIVLGKANLYRTISKQISAVNKMPCAVRITPDHANNPTRHGMFGKAEFLFKLSASECFQRIFFSRVC